MYSQRYGYQLVASSEYPHISSLHRTYRNRKGVTDYFWDCQGPLRGCETHTFWRMRWHLQTQPPVCPIWACKLWHQYNSYATARVYICAILVFKIKNFKMQLVRSGNQLFQLFWKHLCQNFLLYANWWWHSSSDTPGRQTLYNHLLVTSSQQWLEASWSDDITSY